MITFRVKYVYAINQLTETITFSRLANRLKVDRKKDRRSVTNPLLIIGMLIAFATHTATKGTIRPTRGGAF